VARRRSRFLRHHHDICQMERRAFPAWLMLGLIIITARRGTSIADMRLQDYRILTDIPQCTGHKSRAATPAAGKTGTLGSSISLRKDGPIHWGLLNIRSASSKHGPCAGAHGYSTSSGLASFPFSLWSQPSQIPLRARQTHQCASYQARDAAPIELGLPSFSQVVRLLSRHTTDLQLRTYLGSSRVHALAFFWHAKSLLRRPSCRS
jgi:hypothetical protein